MANYSVGQSVTVRIINTPDYGNFGRIKYVDQAGRYWVLLRGQNEPQPFLEEELILTRDMVTQEV